MSFDAPIPRPRATKELYPVDPAVQDLLKLSTFSSDKFDIKDFIASMSEKLIAQSKAEPGPFDPKPFIRTFESAVDVLIDLRKDVQKKTEREEQSCKTAEKEYSKKLSELNKGFESVGKSFNGMESKITEVGRTAVRIGEQLESVHIARQRAQAAHDIVSYWNQFSRGDTTKIEALRKEGREGRQQVAVLLRRLTAVSKELDVKNATRARTELEKYCEKFEKDMLRLFDKSYRKGDPKIMKHCAQTLLEFNGGASCVQIYVNQHDFFISKSRVNETTTIEETHLWEILPDPDASLPKRDLGLAALLEDIRTTVGQEAQIIQAVFPNPPVVMQVFLQRVFEQSIQGHIEMLLEKASAISTLAFLRLLQLAHIQVSALVEDLRPYDLSAVMSAPSSRAAVEGNSLDALETRDARGMGVALPFGTMLESAMEELFVHYIEGTKYIEKESKSLGELYSEYLAKFTKVHLMMRTKASSGGLLDRIANQLASGTGTSLSAAAASSSASSAFAKLSGMASSMKLSAYPGSTTSPVSPVPPVPINGAATEISRSAASTTAGGQSESVNEADGVLSLDTAETMLKWHAEAIGRCVEMSPSAELPKNVLTLTKVLAESLGAGYVEVALETAQVRLDTRDTKLEPDISSSLAVIRIVDLICQLWQQYSSIALIPLTSSSVTGRREIMIFKGQTISHIEGLANTLEQKVIDSIVAWLSAQLQKQKKTDFKPRNDDLSFARVNTDPCTGCCEILEKVRDAAKDKLSGQNLESFLTEIGVTFHSMLLEHFKKFPVSATGGLMLAKDLKSYQDTIATFGISALDERFEFIRQLGNVFLVRPEILKTYITEDHLGRIDSRLLRPYLMQRVDWGQITFDTLLGPVDDLNEAETSTTTSMARVGSEAVKGLRERLGMSRLSVMMKELEGLRGSAATTTGAAAPSGTGATAGTQPTGTGGGYFSFGYSMNS
ncbi:Exocyst complex component 5 [Tulasnella sp. 424]|nr:Exocyst complex component 5 [Tulasnella sp. 424]KAG8982067.1 Exocyst complex component 5 [Tulasnella sp. 425]